MANLTDVILDNCKNKMIHLLRENEVDVESILGIDEVFSGTHCQPFNSLKTAYHQTKYIETQLPYVVYNVICANQT